MKSSDYGAALEALRETIQHDDDELMCDIVETGIDKLEAINAELLETCKSAAMRMEFGDDTDNPTYEKLEQAILKAEEQMR